MTATRLKGSVHVRARVMLVAAGVFVAGVPVAAGATVRPAAAATSHPVTTIASLTKAIPGYSGPNGKKVRNVAPTWLGSPVITPVLKSSKGFLEIHLPMRPNETTVWVKASDVLLSTTPYSIIVNVKTTHLELLKYGQVILNAPVGIGTSVDPTPTGSFYVAFYAASDGPGYGPWQMMTSAHSNTIANWSSTGDALISIHGPLFSDAQIGTRGAYISHGCIRLHSADQLKLGVVPDGTPLNIIN